jgi:hypothetical protein
LLRFESVRGLTFACFLLSACGGPIAYGVQVTTRATVALEAARVADAERLAPYEYFGALEYLRKAREEAAYAHFQDALSYGRKSEELAERARTVAAARAARLQGRSETELPPPPPADAMRRR